jgi:hypothetical protein
MADEEKKKDPLHPETFFLPPLKMVLAFFDKKTHQSQKSEKDTEQKEETVEKNVERLIEKLSKKDE